MQIIFSIIIFELTTYKISPGEGNTAPSPDPTPFAHVVAFSFHASPAYQLALTRHSQKGPPPKNSRNATEL